jgi:hypothetical protein
MQGALKAIGLSLPLVYASATYLFFLRLEKLASPAARKTLNAWIKSDPYTSEHISNLALYIFDKIFGTPLWSPKAMLRIVAISTITTAIVVYAQYPMMFFIAWQVPEMRNVWIVFLVKNIICDYVSLYIVRAWLLRGAEKPIQALFLGPIVGIILVVAIYLVLDVERFSIFDVQRFHPIFFVQGLLQYVDNFMERTANSAIRTGALVVHLWLPLFALGVLAARGINSFRTATLRGQWFVKNGHKRPFHAVGVIMSLVVLGAATAWHLLWG